MPRKSAALVSRRWSISEIVSTFALVIGLLVGNIVKPGAGFGGAMADAAKVAGFAKQAEAQKSVDFFLHIIPDTVVGAFTQGEILQVLLLFDPVRLCSDGTWRARPHAAFIHR